MTMGDDRLESLRASIDNIDAAVVHMLAERFKITKAVGEYKAAVGLAMDDCAACGGTRRPETWVLV